MKRGDEVYFQHEGKRWNYVFVRDVPEAGAVIIKNGIGEFRCKPDEIRLKSEVDAEEYAEKLKEDRLKTAQVVELWSQGLRTGKQMADKVFGEPDYKLSQLIRIAKRRGFISSD